MNTKLKYLVLTLGVVLSLFFASINILHATEPGLPCGDVGGAPPPAGGAPCVEQLAPLNPKFENPLNATSIGQLLNEIIKILIKIGVPISVLFIIYSGFLYVTARGNEEQVKKAHTTLLWTLVGVAVLLGASIISSVLTNTINSITTITT